MKKNCLFLMQTLIILSLLFVFGCSEDVPSGTVTSPPTCIITNPENDAQLSENDDIIVVVEAKSADGSIYDVQFFVDNVQHSVKKESPYEFTIYAGELSVGSHTLKALTRDNQGRRQESTVVNITIIEAVNELPTCVIVSPEDNAKFNIDENISVVVEAEDSDGTIVEVQFFIGEEQRDSKTESPYEFTINAGELSPGSYILKAVAIDDQGDKRTSIVNITINEVINDNEPPTCAIISPENNAKFNLDQDILIAVKAEDSDGTIAEVQLFIGDKKHGSKTASPYEFTVNAGELLPGSYALKAVAIDNLGAKSESSVNITINRPPTCVMINPKNSTEFSIADDVLVTVSAEDSDGSIAEVQLFVNDVQRSSKTASPYNFTINAGELAVGSYTLRAEAIDNQGAKGVSEVVNITIVQPDIESPDFVSFSNGKIPSSWQTTAWFVDNNGGHDDLYSLKTTTNNSAVIAKKTFNSNINFVEFWLKGNGIVDFYVDGSKRKACILTDSWVKHGFYFEEGLHTLKWELKGSSVNLDAISFKNETQLTVGMYYQGGIIVALDGQHGLIAAPEDQSAGIQWYNGSNVTTGATGTVIGTGKDNTTKIVQEQGMGAYAAKLCNDLELNGYSDWYLPSIDELNMLCQSRDVIGGISATGNYWSSTEYSSDRAWYMNFSNNYKSYFYKHGIDINTNKVIYRVRAIRSF